MQLQSPSPSTQCVCVNSILCHKLSYAFVSVACALCPVLWGMRYAIFNLLKWSRSHSINNKNKKEEKKMKWKKQRMKCVTAEAACCYCLLCRSQSVITLLWVQCNTQCKRSERACARACSLIFFAIFFAFDHLIQPFFLYYGQFAWHRDLNLFDIVPSVHRANHKITDGMWK